MLGFHRLPSGDFKEWIKPTEGLFLGHRCWEKALNKEIFASRSRGLKSEGRIEIKEPRKSLWTLVFLAYVDDHYKVVSTWAIPCLKNENHKFLTLRKEYNDGFTGQSTPRETEKLNSDTNGDL